MYTLSGQTKAVFNEYLKYKNKNPSIPTHTQEADMTVACSVRARAYIFTRIIVYLAPVIPRSLFIPGSWSYCIYIFSYTSSRNSVKPFVFTHTHTFACLYIYIHIIILDNVNARTMIVLKLYAALYVLYIL